MTGVPLDTRIALLRQHGNFTQAYSATYQAGLEHFGDERGVIAYKKVWGTALVLSDPLAAKQNVRDLMVRFLREYPDVAFWSVSRPTAGILGPLGFFINEMGPDTRLDLANYDFAGRDKRTLRLAINRIPKSGYTTRESSIPLIGAEKVKAVSNAWRQTRVIRRREVCFLTRPLVFDDEPDVRAFFTFDRDGELAAFSTFDPVYEAGEVVGYVSAQNRYRPDCDPLVHVATKINAIETFQAEGKRWLFLGISPFAGVKNKTVRLNTRGIFQLCYESAFFNRFVYSLQGLAAHKRQYRGVQEQTYYAFNQRPALSRIVKLIRACNIL